MTRRRPLVLCLLAMLPTLAMALPLPAGGSGIVGGIGIVFSQGASGSVDRCESYAAIAAQNLFSPGRNETAATAAVPVGKPILHGVVIEGSRSRAFLEDPSVKRVGGYSVGDPVGGGKLVAGRCAMAPSRPHRLQRASRARRSVRGGRRAR